MRAHRRRSHVALGLAAIWVLAGCAGSPTTSDDPTSATAPEPPEHLASFAEQFTDPAWFDQYVPSNRPWSRIETTPIADAPFGTEAGCAWDPLSPVPEQSEVAQLRHQVAHVDSSIQQSFAVYPTAAEAEAAITDLVPRAECRVVSEERADSEMTRTYHPGAVTPHQDPVRIEVVDSLALSGSAAGNSVSAFQQRYCVQVDVAVVCTVLFEGAAEFQPEFGAALGDQIETALG